MPITVGGAPLAHGYVRPAFRAGWGRTNGHAPQGWRPLEFAIDSRDNPRVALSGVAFFGGLLMSAHKLCWVSAGLFVSGAYGEPPRDSRAREKADEGVSSPWIDEDDTRNLIGQNEEQNRAVAEETLIEGAQTDDPCSNAWEVFEGENDLTSFPSGSLNSADSDLVWERCGLICDPWGCPWGWSVRWAEFVATCTDWVAITSFLSTGEPAGSPLVFATCDCPVAFRYAHGGCPFRLGDNATIAVLSGNCYKIAVFGGHILRIESTVNTNSLCDYMPGGFFGYYGSPLDNWAAFVSCQNDCTSPACSQCFDTDADDDLDLRDFALLQNIFPWF
ncbi:MAG: hypothetical protein Q7R41_06200 [Phycisphaerales bacterium]|nr:hypothetical protein [Phycisphaerales bacterium]